MWEGVRDEDKCCVFCNFVVCLHYYYLNGSRIRRHLADLQDSTCLTASLLLLCHLLLIYYCCFNLYLNFILVLFIFTIIMYYILLFPLVLYIFTDQYLPLPNLLLLCGSRPPGKWAAARRASPW